MRITPMMVHEAAIKVDAALRRHSIIGPILEEKKRFGCVVVFLDEDGDMLLEAVIGEKPSDCVGKHAFAREKIGRTMLMKHRHGHILSRQSEDELTEPPQYAGAVLTKCGASTSGYPSQIDEVSSISLLCQVGALTPDDAIAIFDEHPNKYFDKNRPEDLALLQPL